MSTSAGPPKPVPPPRSPTDPLPRRTSGGSADGRRWELLVERSSVTVTTPAGTVAEAHVSERGEQVVVEFWAEGPDLPTELGADLVTETFALPEIRARRPVLVCVPQRGGAVLTYARRRVGDARAHAAGVTCFIEGRVREDPAPEIPSPASSGLPSR